MRENSEAERILASTLAKTIARRRKELGLTQEEVAMRAGIDRNHYQLMEHARSNRKTNSPLNPTLTTMLKIALVLNIPFDEITREAANAFCYVDKLEHGPR